MAYLQCPRCSTTVEERPGVRTVCPKCGFSGDPPQNYDVRQRRGYSGEERPSSGSGSQGGGQHQGGGQQSGGSQSGGPPPGGYGSGGASPYGYPSSGPSSSSYSSSPYGASQSSGGYAPPSTPVPQQHPHPPQQYGYAPQQPTNGMAVAALVMGITGFCVGITAILAVVFGIIGRQQCRERNEKGEGMATAGIVLGSIVIGLFILWFLFIVSFGAMGYVGGPGS